jgi:hypothetical protein
MATEKRRDWRELCRAASIEQNPRQLMVLISELITALDEHEDSAPTDSHSLVASA